MQEKIISIDPLARLADKIKDDLARCNTAVTQWSEAAINLCIHLAEAKAKIPALIQFGEWCERNGFGESVLNAHDRAAAIKMGENIEAARPILQKTERKSLRHILEKEFRSGHVTKTKKRRADHRKLTDDQALQAARAHLDEGKTLDEAGAMFGVSRKTVKNAVAKEEGRRENPPPDPTKFARTTKAQFDRAVREAVAAKRDEIKADVSKAFDEIFIPHAFERADFANQVLDGRRGIMTAAEYKKILSCLHPDTASAAWKDRCAEAFDLFKGFGRLLVLPEKATVDVSDFPRTVEELLARRKKASA